MAQAKINKLSRGKVLPDFEYDQWTAIHLGPWVYFSADGNSKHLTESKQPVVNTSSPGLSWNRAAGWTADRKVINSDES